MQSDRKSGSKQKYANTGAGNDSVCCSCSYTKSDSHSKPDNYSKSDENGCIYIIREAIANTCCTGDCFAYKDSNKKDPVQEQALTEMIEKLNANGATVSTDLNNKKTYGFSRDNSSSFFLSGYDTFFADGCYLFLVGRPFYSAFVIFNFELGCLSDR